MNQELPEVSIQTKSGEELCANTAQLERQRAAAAVQERLNEKDQTIQKLKEESKRPEASYFETAPALGWHVKVAARRDALATTGVNRRHAPWMVGKMQLMA